MPSSTARKHVSKALETYVTRRGIPYAIPREVYEEIANPVEEIPADEDGVIDYRDVMGAF